MLNICPKKSGRAPTQVFLFFLVSNSYKKYGNACNDLVIYSASVGNPGTYNDLVIHSTRVGNQGISHS